MPLTPQTFQCRSAIPSRHCVSSREVGWRSLLLDHHSGIRSCEPYDSVPTPDVHIGVATGGSYWSESFRDGHWRRGAYAQGSICIHRRGETTRYRFPISDTGSFNTALIYIPSDRFLSAGEHMRRIGHASTEPRLDTRASRDPALVAITMALRAAMAQGADDLYAETAAAWLAVHLITQHGDGSLESDTRRAGQLSDGRLARTVEMISASYAQPLSLERLAAEACVSKYHFARLFRRKTGLTPHQFVRDVRLNAAVHLLANSDQSSGAIALACGFSTPSHFAATFRSKFGASPRAYRVSLRR